MKRTTVVVGERLLEKLRSVTGERTYSGAIRKALQKIVLGDDFSPALRADATRRLLHSGPTKRTSVLLDEELLEKTRKVIGEPTYSGAIRIALQEIVRRHDFREALHAFQEEAAKGGFFHPDYLKEKRASSILESEERKRVSAHAKRISGKKSGTLGSR